MNKFLQIFGAYFLCILLHACTSSSRIIVTEPSVEPMTYAPTPTAASLDRSVGLLRRLAILPPVLEISPRNSRWCMNPCDPEGDREQLMSSVTEYLQDWRGYEVERLDSACLEDLNASACILARSLAKWSKKVTAQQTLPEDIAKDLTSLGKELAVDGVLLLQGKFDYTNYADILHWTATLTASAYWDLAHGDVADLEVSIFSVADPKLVWLSKTTINQFGTSPTYGRVETYGESLLATLEPALPKVFTRPKENYE